MTARATPAELSAHRTRSNVRIPVLHPDTVREIDETLDDPHVAATDQGPRSDTLIDV